MGTRSVVVHHRGGMRFTGITPDGRTTTMDDAEGGGGPSPIDTLLIALAGCTAMDVLSILRKKRQDVASYAVETGAIQRDEYPKVFTRVDLVHVVAGPALDTTAVRRAVELSALKYCPVSAMLCAGTVEVHHRYRIERPGEAPDEGEVVVRGPNAPAVAEAGAPG